MKVSDAIFFNSVFIKCFLVVTHNNYKLLEAQ